MTRATTACVLAGLLLAAGCASRGPDTLAELKPSAPVPLDPGSRVDADRQAAIAGYQRFLQDARDPALRARALRRLGDLTLEESEARAAADASADSDGVREAIRLYEQRLADYPDAADNARVLYQLSRAYDNDGQRAEALAALDRLVRDHPNSPLVVEAQFRRGETLFVDRRYSEAERAYSAVLGAGADSGFHAQALYKRGWSLFKLNLYPEAIADFVALMDLRGAGGSLQLERLARAEREQVEDALRAVSFAFSYGEGAATIEQYYAGAGHRRHQDLVYEALAELHLSKERYSDAAATFEAFVGADPTHLRAPAFQLRALEVYRQAGFNAQTLAAKARFVELYRLDGPFWDRRAPADHPEVTTPLAATLVELAQHFHAAAQKRKQPADYEHAFGYYRQYLSGFDDRPEAQELRFLYAELLFEARDYAEAAAQYERAAYTYSPGGRAAEAGYAALLAYEAHAKTLAADALDAWESLALASAQRFATSFRDHPQAAGALSRAADRLFARGEGAAAAQAAEALLNEHPGAEPAQRLNAWIILGHTAFDAADFLKAEHAYLQTLASPALKPAQRPALRERLAASIYKQGEARRAEGDLAGAVEHFLRVGAAVAESPIRATAEYDAAALLIQLQRWAQAIVVLEAFRRDYPKHALQADVTQKLAVAYMADDRPGAAAEEFSRIAAASADPAIQREALLKAAELHEQAGDPRRAARVLEQFIAGFPRPLEPAVEARQRLVEIYARLGDARQQRHWQEEIILADAKAGAERSARTRTLAAQASLALAEDSYLVYQAIRLVEPIKQNLKRKRDTMQAALKAYTRAADYGIAEVTTAATFQIAAIYGDFAKALLASERPKGLDELALEEYELLLEEEAYPFEEKAIQLHELNAGRAAQGLYDSWVRRSFSALARLLPARYAKLERKDDVVETLQ